MLIRTRRGTRTRRPVQALHTPCCLEQRTTDEQAIRSALLTAQPYRFLDALLAPWQDDRWERPPLCRRQASVAARPVPKLVDHVACGGRVQDLSPGSSAQSDPGAGPPVPALLVVDRSIEGKETPP